MEATPGFEPGIRALQAPALATWPRRLIRRRPPFSAQAPKKGDNGGQKFKPRLVEGQERQTLISHAPGLRWSDDPQPPKIRSKKPSWRLGVCERIFWSGRRELNPRRQPWQGCTLPLSYSRSASPRGERQSNNHPPWCQHLSSALHSPWRSFIPASIHLRARMRATGEIMAIRA